MTDTRQEEYNKFTYLPTVPYKCVEYLMDNNELMWKLLYYTNPNVWKDDYANLTKIQKASIIYDGIKSENSCRVFLDYGQDDSWTQEVCILRVSVLEAIPSNYVWGYLTVGFEVYSHYKINQLSNYQTRSVAVAQSIISTLNGADLGEGVGRLYFDYQRNPRSKMFLVGNAPFKGTGFTICNYSLG